MIVYESDKNKFLEDVDTNQIDEIILESVRKSLHRSTSPSEIDSWKNSMNYMYRILADPEIPNDCGIAIEYQLPQTSKRLDFIITGRDQERHDHAMIIELKQWSSAKSTNKDGLVRVRFKHGETETPHPSYQAWSYASYLNDFNEAVYSGQIALVPCAYLHNYPDDGVITNSFYDTYLAKAPVFLENDAKKLRNFIKQFIKYGDKREVLYTIEAGKIKPSKDLADSLSSMLSGNPEFLMLDEQKIVYENALSLVATAQAGPKQVLIVEGGPGTGKSVVALNLLGELTRRGLVAQYVSKNAAPRNVYENKLTGSLKASRIRNLLKGSGSYTETAINSVDALVIDEAHRLNEKSGIFSNKGENQIHELIHSAKCSIFFIDENQKVSFKDIGSKDEVYKWAKMNGATVTEFALSSQFRCNGSDGYIAWLDNSLQIRATANINLTEASYDFKIFDSPSRLREAIFEMNKFHNKARLVAGYCWDWASKKDPSLFDINIPEFDFAAKWNLASDGSLWIILPDSVSEVGCIHTCQGLELEYVGVIIGPDLIVRNDQVLTFPAARAKTDKSLHGYKKMFDKDPDAANKLADQIIKNTYRTLMTRGMKGCYVYFTDKETEAYFRKLI